MVSSCWLTPEVRLLVLASPPVAAPRDAPMLLVLLSWWQSPDVPKIIPSFPLLTWDRGLDMAPSCLSLWLLREGSPPKFFERLRLGSFRLPWGQVTSSPRGRPLAVRRVVTGLEGSAPKMRESLLVLDPEGR